MTFSPTGFKYMQLSSLEILQDNVFPIIFAQSKLKESKKHVM